MAVDHIRYDILAQDALRGVVRTVLVDAAKNGLPGEHHFFITFDTGAEGVQVSPRMRAQYPADMTIVLQYQFWDLVVAEDGFSVGLSFGGVAEKVAVKFAAIKRSSTPRCRSASVRGVGGEPTGGAPGGTTSARAEPLAATRHRHARATIAAVPTPANHRSRLPRRRPRQAGRRRRGGAARPLP
jgi:hypothetical protein